MSRPYTLRNQYTARYPYYANLGKGLKTLRLLKGVKQNHFAEDIKVPANLLSAWEHNKHRVPHHVIESYARYFKTEPERILAFCRAHILSREKDLLKNLAMALREFIRPGRPSPPNPN